MEQVGILGTGRMGVRLALLLAQAGNRVVLGSRTPGRAARIAQSLGEPLIEAGSYEAAASRWSDVRKKVEDRAVILKFTVMAVKRAMLMASML